VDGAFHCCFALDGILQDNFYCDRLLLEKEFLLIPLLLFYNEKRLFVVPFLSRILTFLPSVAHAIAEKIGLHHCNQHHKARQLVRESRMFEYSGQFHICR